MLTSMDLANIGNKDIYRETNRDFNGLLTIN